jgi:hypothetical protein
MSVVDNTSVECINKYNKNNLLYINQTNCYSFDFYDIDPFTIVSSFGEVYKSGVSSNYDARNFSEEKNGTLVDIKNNHSVENFENYPYLNYTSLEPHWISKDGEIYQKDFKIHSVLPTPNSYIAIDGLGQLVLIYNQHSSKQVGEGLYEYKSTTPHTMNSSVRNSLCAEFKESIPIQYDNKTYVFSSLENYIDAERYGSVISPNNKHMVFERYTKLSKRKDGNRDKKILADNFKSDLLKWNTTIYDMVLLHGLLIKFQNKQMMDILQQTNKYKLVILNYDSKMNRVLTRHWILEAIRKHGINTTLKDAIKHRDSIQFLSSEYNLRLFNRNDLPEDKLVEKKLVELNKKAIYIRNLVAYAKDNQLCCKDLDKVASIKKWVELREEKREERRKNIK